MNRTLLTGLTAIAGMFFCLSWAGFGVVAWLIVSSRSANVTGAKADWASEPKKTDVVTKAEKGPSNKYGQAVIPELKVVPAAAKLQTIFRHSKRLSEAKLIKATEPIPSGWEGGEGFRTLRYIEQARWENNLNSILANGKEGDTAEIQH